MNNGYIQIDIDGEPIGIKFGLPAKQWLMKILNDHPEFLESGDAGINATYAAAILYTGYQNNCSIKLAKVEKDFEFFLNFIETTVDSEPEKALLDAVLECWTNSVEVQKIIKAQEDTEVKKKNGSLKKLKRTATVA